MAVLIFKLHAHVHVVTFFSPFSPYNENIIVKHAGPVGWSVRLVSPVGRLVNIYKTIRVDVHVLVMDLLVDNVTFNISFFIIILLG